MENQTFKVFLCSSYSDLIIEREAVLNVIQRLQLVHASMEFFGARPETPLETVLGEIRTSDIVIVIIGYRYGTFVPGKKFSYTEIEYKEAWKKTKPCLVYLRSNDVPILPSHIEKDPFRIKALEKFKRLLQSRHVVSFYSQAQDLAVNVAVDIGRTVIKIKQESTDSTLSILDYLNTPSFLCDTNNRISNVNQTLTKVLGYSASEMVGKALTEFIDNTNDVQWSKNSISYYADKGCRYIELTLKKKDGYSIYFELDILKYELHGNAIIQCVARDITERKRTEQELLEMNEQLGAQNEELQLQSERLIAQQQELIEKVREVEKAQLRIYSEKLEQMVEERTGALQEVQNEQRNFDPLAELLGQAQNAYIAYMEAEGEVARGYKQREYTLDKAYKVDERSINKIFEQSIAQALITREETLQKDPLSYQQAIDTYDEVVKQALITFKDAMEKAWKTRSDAIEQAWHIYHRTT